MVILAWNPEKKIVVFSHNNTTYKAKLVGYNKVKAELYLYVYNFNSVQTISVGTAQPSIIPASKDETSPFLTEVTSPLSGRVIKIYAAAGRTVAEGTPLVSIESMKMENEILAPCNLFIKNIPITEGHLVKQGEVLVIFEPLKKEL